MRRIKTGIHISWMSVNSVIISILRILIKHLMVVHWRPRTCSKISPPAVYFYMKYLVLLEREQKHQYPASEYADPIWTSSSLQLKTFSLCFHNIIIMGLDWLCLYWKDPQSRYWSHPHLVVESTYYINNIPMSWSKHALAGNKKTFRSLKMFEKIYRKYALSTDLWPLGRHK